MKHLLSIVLTAILCATASAQTIRTLGYNATNGTIVYTSTNQLTFTNAVRLSTGQTANASVGSSVDLAKALWDTANDAPALVISNGEVALADDTVPENFRIQLGIPWSGLTNTNAATMLAAFGLGGNPTNETGTPPAGDYFVWAASGLWDRSDGGSIGWRVEDAEIFIGPFMAVTNAPTNTTNAARWLRVIDGTNNYLMPLYK